MRTVLLTWSHLSRCWWTDFLLTRHLSNDWNKPRIWSRCGTHCRATFSDHVVHLRRLTCFILMHVVFHLWSFLNSLWCTLMIRAHSFTAGHGILRRAAEFALCRGILTITWNFVEFEKWPVISTIIGVMSNDWLISHSFQSTHVISHEFHCTLKKTEMIFLVCC